MIGNTDPSFPSNAPTALSVAENAVAGATVGTVAATTDPDGDTLTYNGWTSGVETQVFDIDGDGAITVRDAGALDHEAKRRPTVRHGVGKRRQGVRRQRRKTP